MRAQTTLDFAIGMSVFLLAVVFVFTFVPGILEPFEAGTQEETTVADRVASQLVHTSLAAPTEPFVLTLPCTNGFFNTTTGAPADCGFDHSADLSDGDSLTDRIGVAGRHRVNVTLLGDVDGDGDVNVLCYDNDDHEVTETDVTSGAVCGESPGDTDRTVDTDVVYALGPTPPGTQAVVASRRTVQVDGHTATVEVRVW